MKLQDIAVIGVGNMGGALVSSWIKKKVVDSKQLHLYDAYKDCRKIYSETNAYTDLKSCIENVDYIFLCVKPSDVNNVLESITESNPERKSPCLVSIAAGMEIEYLSKTLGGSHEVVRVMPNTPLLVGEGAAAISFSSNCSSSTKTFLYGLFDAVAEVVEVEEKLMNTVTGLSGSGPAFIYILIEAMADAGVNGGLSREQALKLAAQTVYGAAKMVLSTGENPSILKDKVSSPGGTTIAGIRALEDSGFRSAIQSGIETAIAKSASLKK